VAQADLIRGIVDGLGGRGAGSIDRVGGHAGGELRQQAHLAGHVRGEHRRHDLAEHHLVYFPAVHLAPVQQLAGGIARQGDGGNVTKDGAALGERSPDAGYDCNPPARPGIGHSTPG
jgi:hypothetical protein